MSEEKENIIKDIENEEIMEKNNEEINILSQYLYEVSRFPKLNKEDEIKYFEKYRNGDKNAKEVIIGSNLRFVVSVAKKYSAYSYAFLDLIQEGTIGLLEAFERFELEKGNLFSTYAVWWIKKYMLLYIDSKAELIRYPDFAKRKIKKINDFRKEYIKEKGKQPETKEIAEFTGMREEEIKEYISMDFTNVEFEVPEIEDDSTMKEVINNLEMYEVIKLSKKCLNQQEIKTIELRYGLIDGVERTFQEIGDMMGGLGRSRTKQIHDKAINKLKDKFGRGKK